MRITNYHYLTYNLADIKRFIPSNIPFVNTNYYGFNMSAIPIPNTNVLVFSIRFAVKEKEDGVNDNYIVPGNSITTKVFMGEHANPRELPGKNFFWSRWLKAGIDNTFIFLGTYDGKTIKKISPFLKLPYIDSPLFKGKITRVGTDHRLVKIGDKICLHSRNMSYIVELDIESNGMKLNFGNLVLMNQTNRLGSDPYTHLNASIIKKTDGGIMVLDLFDNCVTYKHEFNPVVMENLKQSIPEHIFNELKKYETTLVGKKKGDINENAIRIIKIDPYSEESHETGFMCFYKKDKLSVFGTDTNPMFCFGSPCIEIRQNKYLSCGHLKIRQKYNVGSSIVDYKSDSAPYLVREFIHNTMHDTFGTNYVTHFGHNDGYIYMIYFYTIQGGEKGVDDINDLSGVKVKITHAYLPINLDKEYCSEFKSSVIFNMTLFESKIQKKRMINLTCGEMDFYAPIISTELSEILNECNHDVSEFDYSKFEYHLLPYYDGKSYDLTIDYRNNRLLDEYSKPHAGLKEFLKSKSYPYKITPAKRNEK